MSYSDLTDKQAVSFNNLQDGVSAGVFRLITTIPSSNEQITKSDASTYVYLDTSYSTYSSKSSNQIIVKQDLKPSFQYSGTWYRQLTCHPTGFPNLMCGWTSDYNACVGYPDPHNYPMTIYWNGSLTTGTKVFTPQPLLHAASPWPWYLNRYYFLSWGANDYSFTVNEYFVELPLTTGFLYGAVVNTLDDCGGI